MTGSEQAVQLAAESDRIAGQIEKHDTPAAVPGPPPTGDRVAAAKGTDPTGSACYMLTSQGRVTPVCWE